MAVMEGDTAILGCKISGQPIPAIKWYAFYYSYFNGYLRKFLPEYYVDIL